MGSLALGSAILISLFFPPRLLADNLGDYFFKQEAYREAVTEYKRILFFEDFENRGDVLYNLANSYYHWNRPREAEKILLDLSVHNSSKEVDIKAMALLARIHWDSYNYEAMRTTLDELSLELKPSDKQDIQYIKAWTYIYQAEWDRGMRIFQDLQDPGLDSLVEELRGVYDVPQNSVALARLLSRFVPGWGQLYSGDYENAIYSFLLVGSIRASLLWDIYQKAYSMAIVKYLFLHTRYSKGSIYNMESRIVRRNVDRIGDFLKRVSDRYPDPVEVLERIAMFDLSK